jgi:pentatricopeptide repeat protein
MSHFNSDAGIEAGTISYTRVIKACAESRDAVMAEHWLSEMLDAGGWSCKASCWILLLLDFAALDYRDCCFCRPQCTARERHAPSRKLMDGSFDI